MKEEKNILIKYRIERSRESLTEAKLLLDGGHCNTFINRLYYACYYAVTALLLTKELTASKHSGIRSQFHQHFIKPGIIEIKYGQIYDRLFDNRQKADYADLVSFEIKEVAPWYDDAEEFVERISGIINL